MRPIIRSNKHLVQISLDQVVAGTVDNIAIVEAKHSDNQGTASHVDVGDTVKAVYVEIWLLATSSQPGSATVILEKVPASQDPADSTQMASLQTYTNKKNILFTSQGVIGDANANPVPFMRQWYKIPKGKQRFGLGDNLYLNIRANLESITFCGLAVFKSYN